MNLKEATKFCSDMGIRLTKLDGEYRVAPMGKRIDTEYCAYYTDDLEDAVNSALHFNRVAADSLAAELELLAEIA